MKRISDIHTKQVIKSREYISEQKLSRRIDLISFYPGLVAIRTRQEEIFDFKIVENRGSVTLEVKGIAPSVQLPFLDPQRTAALGKWLKVNRFGRKMVPLVLLVVSLKRSLTNWTLIKYFR